MVKAGYRAFGLASYNGAFKFMPRLFDRRAVVLNNVFFDKDDWHKANCCGMILILVSK